MQVIDTICKTSSPQEAKWDLKEFVSVIVWLREDLCRSDAGLSAEKVQWPVASTGLRYLNKHTLLLHVLIRHQQLNSARCFAQSSVLFLYYQRNNDTDIVHNKIQNYVMIRST
jgi:hypothetical protein